MLSVKWSRDAISETAWADDCRRKWQWAWASLHALFRSEQTVGRKQTQPTGPAESERCRLWRGMGMEGVWILLWVRVFRGPWQASGLSWGVKDRDVGVEDYRGKPKRDQESYSVNLEFFLLFIKMINGEIWWQRYQKNITSHSKRLSETRGWNLTDLNTFSLFHAFIYWVLVTWHGFLTILS